MKYEQFLANAASALSGCREMKEMLSAVQAALSAVPDMVRKNERLEKEHGELSAENAALKAELDDWKGNAEGFQPDEYMKLPLDADGVPIHIGDVLYSSGNECRVVSVTVKADEACVGVHTDEGAFLPSVNPKYLSRKSTELLESEVLDADGVPIEVGDTVYCDEEVRPLEVVRLHAGDGGYCTVGVKDSEGRIISADAPRLSHKSPDSWEKLADDVADFDAFEYCVDVLEIDTSDFSEAQERRTMKADVIRRAKKLAGIEEEAER